MCLVRAVEWGLSNRETAPGEVAWSKVVQLSSRRNLLSASSAAQGRNCWGVCLHAGLTHPSSGRAAAGFAHRVPPLMSNVRAREPVGPPHAIARVLVDAENRRVPRLVSEVRATKYQIPQPRSGVPAEGAHGLLGAPRGRVQRPRCGQALHEGIGAGRSSFGGRRAASVTRCMCGRSLQTWSGGECSVRAVE